LEGTAESPPAADATGANSSTSADELLQWDQDPEQRAAAAEEFQAISDRTTEIQVEEMPAYWRLLEWVKEQSLDSLKVRSPTGVPYNDLRQRPSEYRGTLMRVDLHVRRVLQYDIPENPLGLSRLYEVWGWTEESGAWPYVGIVPELPEGFPVGAKVSQRATLHGYFFKLQGYMEAKSAPRAAPLVAPLLLGRLESQPQQEGAAAPLGSEISWGFGLVTVFGALLASRLLWFALRFNSRKPRVAFGGRAQAPLPTADEWERRIAGKMKNEN
jgi:hypothetical protein